MVSWTDSKWRLRPSLLARVFVASITFVGQFAWTVDHHFVSPVIGNIDEILLTLITSVENARIPMHGHMMALQIEGAVEDLVANLTNRFTSFLTTTPTTTSAGGGRGGGDGG